MILTNCAACAAPLAHDHKKRCSRCKTRYCNEACQRDHWERGGHEALCRRIKRAGGAEQYHADKKYKEAVAETLREAGNYASLLNELKRFKEAKALLRKTMLVARRVLGDENYTTLRVRWTYAEAIWMDADATLDDVREAITTLDGTVRIARRVLGGDHPTVSTMEGDLEGARAALRFREKYEVELSI